VLWKGRKRKDAGVHSSDAKKSGSLKGISSSSLRKTIHDESPGRVVDRTKNSENGGPTEDHYRVWKVRVLVTQKQRGRKGKLFNDGSGQKR